MIEKLNHLILKAQIVYHILDKNPESQKVKAFMLEAKNQINIMNAVAVMQKTSCPKTSFALQMMKMRLKTGERKLGVEINFYY